MIETQTHFWMIRHGKTYRNQEGRIQGNSNCSDTHIIPEQIVPYLEDLDVKALPTPQVIAVSNLTRTQETALALLGFRGWSVPLLEDPRLHERHQGILDNKTNQEVLDILVNHPSTQGKNKQDIGEIIDAPGFALEGQETMEQVRKRAKSAIRDLVESYPHQIVGMVLHAGVIKALGYRHQTICEFTVSRDTSGSYHYHADKGSLSSGA